MSTLVRRTARPLPGCCLVVAVTATVGCSLSDYRKDADCDAYNVVQEAGTDPRWAQPHFSIQLDPRSRYYDSYDPDREPMPPDDPAAHRYMHCVDGMRGWPCWDQFGVDAQLENPAWRERLGEYVELTNDGAIKLSLDSALRLAYIHSPDYQEQLETLYLSALDVTTERFRLDTQFFGGNLTNLTHRGRRRGPDTLTTVTDLELQRRFATAGELMVGFANSFVWQFAGPNTNSAFSLVNFNLVQPLLRGAGRDRALEQLTRVERGLLGNLRQLERYRHGLYTEVAVGDLGVGQVGRLGGFTGGTGLTGFTGTGQGGLGGVGSATGFGGGFFGGGAGGAGAGGGAGLAGGGAGQVGGFIGLLQSLQEIRNTQYSLDLQLRTLALLESNLAAGTIDLSQVDQFRQNIETLRAQLLQARTGLEAALDSYKTRTLGLPPDLEVDLDDQFIAQFQLIDPQITDLQNRLTAFQDTVGALPADPPASEIAMMIERGEVLLSELHAQFGVTESDVTTMHDRSEQRQRDMQPAEQRMFQRDLAEVGEDFARRPTRFTQLQQGLQQIREVLAADQRADSLRQLVGWSRSLANEVQSLSLIQARARLEAIVLEDVEIDSRAAVHVARTHRLDLMNSRAALVDSWRLIAFNADQLQSVLDVRFEGDLRTTGNNPVKFRGPTGSLTASVDFDAPFTRLLERNNYRQALVDYQQSRRRFVQFDDSVNQTIRQRLRNLQQLRVNLEIQRRAVVISIRRVDFTRAELNRPLPAPLPGAPPNTFGPTAVQNLLSALSDLSNAQNNFMSVWLNYYAERMQLMRDLGVMRLDEEGRWIDVPLDSLLAEGTGACMEQVQLPPAVPPEWWQWSESPAPEAVEPLLEAEVAPPEQVPAAVPQTPTPAPGPLLLEPLPPPEPEAPRAAALIIRARAVR